MPWIETIDETNATGQLKDVYDEIANARGKLSNIMRVHSLRPRAMQAHMDLYLQLLFCRSGLTRAERELIAVVVSAANDCEYCVRHHGEALRAYWRDDARVEAVIDDYRTSGDMTPRRMAVLDYAVKLTTEPTAATEADVRRLRENGLSDLDILDVNLITSYFNFVNRIANGLGVDVTEDEASGFRY